MRFGGKRSVRLREANAPKQTLDDGEAPRAIVLASHLETFQPGPPDERKRDATYPANLKRMEGRADDLRPLGHLLARIVLKSERQPVRNSSHRPDNASHMAAKPTTMIIG